MHNAKIVQFFSLELSLDLNPPQDEPTQTAHRKSNEMHLHGTTTATEKLERSPCLSAPLTDGWVLTPVEHLPSHSPKLSYRPLEVSNSRSMHMDSFLG